jgi:hypothetical protein
MEQNALEEEVSENFHLGQETDEDRALIFPIRRDDSAKAGDWKSL